MIKESEFILKDSKTNLLWQDTKEGTVIKRDFLEAQNYCQNLELDGYKIFIQRFYHLRISVGITVHFFAPAAPFRVGINECNLLFAHRFGVTIVPGFPFK